jgi:hypothetical protein
MIKINIIYEPDNSIAFKIRTFVCKCQASDDYAINPLEEFNKLLTLVTQEAFNDGRNFEKNSKM